MHRPLFVLAAGSAAAVGGLLVASAMPAGAATSIRTDAAQTGPCIVPTGSASGTACTPLATTPVTFTVTTTGTLSISAPLTTVDLGSGHVGSVIGFYEDFGAVTVTDDRALDPADWTATVSSTNFTNTTTSSDVILASDATYNTGTIGADTVSGLPLPGSTYLTAEALGGFLSNSAEDAVTVTGFDGDNAATWTPTFAVYIPGNAVVGTYNGVVTHSVS
jgi:hypothetical protein